MLHCLAAVDGVGCGVDGVSCRHGREPPVAGDSARRRPVSERSEPLGRQPEPMMIIAIDGPSGVGKGTVARAVADALGFRHVDTGAMYRGVAWRALHDRVPLDDEPALTALAERLAIETSDGGVRVDGVDVTAAIRNPEIDRAAARVARVPGVRAALVGAAAPHRQRRRPGDGGPRHRDRRLSRRPGEDLPRRLVGGARPPAAARRTPTAAPATRPRWPPNWPPATSPTARGPWRRWPWPRTPT